MYNFQDFIEKIKESSVESVQRQAEDEYAQIKRARGKKADTLRKAGAMDYMNKLGAFLFFMKNGFSSFNKEEYLILRPIFEKWVKKGQISSSILERMS